MTWPARFDRQRISLFVEGRISSGDAERQTRTAEEILRRFDDRPGQILADEVGMGKTFVALAVAVTAALVDKKRRPVVVMVPPSVREKWPRDFETFRNNCLRTTGDGAGTIIRASSADTGLDFLRLLDDPPKTRPHLIFLTHGAFHRQLSDPWVKYAILKHALKPRRFRSRRKVLPRFAADILGCPLRLQRTDIFEDLMHRTAPFWRSVLENYGEGIGDDPVPDAIFKVLKKNRVDFSGLRKVLLEMPLRKTKHYDSYIKLLRRSVAELIRDVWDQAMVEARFRSPLLIMDEAHHLKNPSTRLASLFVDRAFEEDARSLDGALNGVFGRMLFLTATPFQLGHHELMSVIKRFGDIQWQRRNPSMSHREFDFAHSELTQSLDNARRNAVRLDDSWARVDKLEQGLAAATDDELDQWWRAVRTDPVSQPETVRTALRAYEKTSSSMVIAQRRLQPWVIRHLRSRQLPDESDFRRHERIGAAICDDGSDANCGGLIVKEQALLPFLLAARAQATAARNTEDLRIRRATFAEGLSSSYEAFLKTRAVELADGSMESDLDEDATGTGPSGDSAIHWYMDQLQGALPIEAGYGAHPKVGPTVTRACDLWVEREKILIFCHFRATGTALMQHISAELAVRIRRLGQEKLGCDAGDVEKQLVLLGDRFSKGRPLYRNLEDLLREMLANCGNIDGDQAQKIIDVVARFVRTPAFLVRYFPLGSGDTVNSFTRAIETEDASQMTLKGKLRVFVEFLSDRCEPGVRDEYLAALDSIQTGIRYGGALPGDPYTERFALQASVRRASGLDKKGERRRSLLGFNTPFFPEILVASSVLAEGVDLHLDCRHIIHHDLCWNPSTLEQRTGRIDRIGAKAEQANKPIQIYLPYIAETQDEKMYRVVRDRERWFHVLMSAEYKVDEIWGDRISTRLPLPAEAASDLTFDLSVDAN